VQHAECGLAQRLGDRELVHLFVVALLQVDDLALARARHEDHGKAVRRRVRECREAVQETRSRHGEAHAGSLREVAGRGGRIARVLLVAKRDDSQALGLRHAQEVRDRDPGQREKRIEAVEFQRVDEKVKAVGGLGGLVFGRHGMGVGACEKAQGYDRNRYFPLLLTAVKTGKLGGKLAEKLGVSSR
jgi:hypothetical protein